MRSLPLITLLSLIAVMHADAQYYYKDIVSNKQLMDEMVRLKEQKVRTVSVKSFEDDGSPSDGFFCEKKINRNYSSVETLTRSNVTGSSQFLSTFNKNGLLEKTVDSADIAVTTVTYEYDANGRIRNIISGVRSSDDDFSNAIMEQHLYEYNDKGVIVKMYRIKNGNDSTLILFTADEKNNITIEKDTRSGKSYYYYYDGRNRLTDVVHMNTFNDKLLPDYLFEYNNNGQVTQMTTTEEGGSYYYVWKYTYENDLRKSERCFSKERRLMGSIEYDYK